MKIDIDLSEIHDLSKAFARDIAVTSGRAERAVEAATGRLHARAVADAPVASGDLKASITRDTAGLSRRVYSPLKQGFFQEYGTSRHPPQAWLMIHAESAHADLERELGVFNWGLG